MRLPWRFTYTTFLLRCLLSILINKDRKPQLCYLHLISDPTQSPKANLLDSTFPTLHEEEKTEWDAEDDGLIISARSWQQDQTRIILSIVLSLPSDMRTPKELRSFTCWIWLLKRGRSLLSSTYNNTENEIGHGMIIAENHAHKMLSFVKGVHWYV